MIKSKIFFKAIFVVTALIISYTVIIFLFALPKIDSSINNIEEKSGKQALSKVVTVVKNVHKDLESYKRHALKRHKEELKHLTHTVWSIIQIKYEQSKPENIGVVLKDRGDKFKENLEIFYNTYKEKLSNEQLKQAIINYVNIHRYNNNTGYFFITHKTTSIFNPTQMHSNGIDLKDVKDANGVYFIQEFNNVCEENGSGIVNYDWENPKSKKIEKKISYVFKFEPFDWIIGTGEYYSVLQKALQDEVVDLVSRLHYDGNNYFFISDYNNVLIAHPYLKGKDFSEVFDTRGNLIIPPIVKIARKYGEGFHSYWWKKNSEDDTPYEKLTFSKHFPDWKMIIGTGVYIDDIQREVDKRKEELIQQLHSIIQETKIGQTGYLYIFDGKANMLVHPNSNINGTNFSKLKNPGKNSYIFDDLLKSVRSGEKTLNYNWDRPTDKGNYIYNKVSWIEYIPELDWYVCSSAYMDEFKTSSNQLKEFIIVLALIVVVVSILIGFLFFRNLLHPISNLSKIALKVTSGDYSQKCVAKSNDEIGTLSQEFNKMIHTIKENIEKLDLKVEQRTKELAEQKRVFETLFYDTSDGILLLSNGRFIDCNDAVVKMLKYQSKDDLLSIHPSELSPEYQPDGSKSFEKANELMQECLDKGSNHFEWIHQRADGETFWAEIVLTKLNIHNEDIIHVVWRDIEDRKQLETEIQNKSKELESIYHSLQDSIEYASQIQNAIIPQERLFEKYFNEHFIFWEQKDTVGGDIYLFEELRHSDEALLMVIDCTGHGVPGAFVTMLVKAIEREVITKINKSDLEVSPAVILQHFNQTMKKLLGQESVESISNAGFDGSIVYINKKEKILKFAGAQSPFIYIQDDIIEVIKGDRHSIGYKKSNREYQFKEYVINLDKPLHGYLVTDGYFDQTGGEKGFLFGKKRFIKLIEANYRKPLLHQKKEFIDRLDHYQGNQIRKDDITIIGFKI